MDSLKNVINDWTHISDYRRRNITHNADKFVLTEYKINAPDKLKNNKMGKMKKIIICKLQFNNAIISSTLLIGVISFIITGCQALPPGNPPQGPIVSIKTTGDNTLVPKDAINNMTTAIATCPYLYTTPDTPYISLYPTKISIGEKKHELQLNYLTVKLYRNLIEMDIIKCYFATKNKKPDFLLASTFSKIFTDNIGDEKGEPLLFNWEIKLLPPGNNKSRSTWKQNIIVKLNSKSISSKLDKI